jgi:hypothetical protein
VISVTVQHASNSKPGLVKTPTGLGHAQTGGRRNARCSDRRLDHEQGSLLLVLNNGSSHAVTDYWVADGYLEYNTPTAHAATFHSKLSTYKTRWTKMLPVLFPFVLRAAPAQNR